MFLTVPEAVRRIRAGKTIIVVDDATARTRATWCAPPRRRRRRAVNFMLKHGRGILCAPMSAEMADRLGLKLMVPRNTAKFGTPFTESVDARRGTTTGTSAFDRARTLRALADPRTAATTCCARATCSRCAPCPAACCGAPALRGRARPVRARRAAAGRRLCEILTDDGAWRACPQLERFARAARLGILTIRDLIAYRRQREMLVRRLVTVPLPTPRASSAPPLPEQARGRSPRRAGARQIAGGGRCSRACHSQCLTGDVFGSQRCDCGAQMHAALRAIAKKGRGVFLYLRQEGRGIGLEAKLKAYALQDRGLDTVEANLKLGYPADLRDYGIGAQILVDLGVREIDLLTNNPRKIVGARSLRPSPSGAACRSPCRRPGHNRRYLATKRDKLGHLLDLRLGET
jgi:3,4-dihydroxy 2-butanone 4-phosphate synthase/GTP cyclohydrolase II